MCNPNGRRLSLVFGSQTAKTTLPQGVGWWPDVNRALAKSYSLTLREKRSSESYIQGFLFNTN